MKAKLILAACALVAILRLDQQACAQTTAFTYQGRLNDGANPANGAYDLTFTLFNASSGGAALGASNVFNDLLISNGLFTVTLDYGAQFDGNARWLQIAVRPGASVGAYTNVTPRQALLPAPYAIYAASAGTGGGGIWSLNGANAYYNGGGVGVGTASPVTRFTVAGAGAYNSPTAAAITLDNTTAGRRWEWHALDDGRMQLADFTFAATRLVIDTAGKVGIGTDSPANKLSVFTDTDSYGLEHTDGNVRLATYVGVAGAELGTISNHKLNFFVNNGPASMTVDTSGHVGIGTTTPFSKLEVAGDAGIDGPLWIKSGNGTPLLVLNSFGESVFVVEIGPTNNLYMFGDAYKNSGGTSWGTFSDRRLKQDVRAYEPGLSEVLQLRPVRFHYRDDAKLGLTSAQEEVGFVAQEVREVIPDAVTEGKDGYLMLKADPIHWAAINAIRELNTKLEEQHAENAELKQEVADLKKLMNAFRQRLDGGVK